MSEPDLPPDEPSSSGRLRIRLAAAAALVLIFVAGAAVGWGMSTRLHGQMRHGRSPQRPQRGMVAYFERLHLRPEQKVAIDSIFARRRVQIDAFWKGPGQQLRVILDSTRADVRTVLDSAQRATYDSLPDPSRRGGPGGMRGDGRPSTPVRAPGA